MAENGGRLLGLYDELTTQLNLYRGKGLSLTREMAIFLQLLQWPLMDSCNW